VLRYGEEIGMGENLRLKERDAIRTPMQWSAGPNGGFSTAERLVRPAIDSGPYGYEHVNVEQQLRDPGSLLRWLTRLIRVRKQCPEIGGSEWRVLATRRPSVLALQYGPVVCVHNLSDEPQELTVDVGLGVLESLLGEETSLGRGGRHRLRIEPLGYAWYRGRD
jgi:maltose alpha-D-glucosyltransferase/alpha-amylase